MRVSDVTYTSGTRDKKGMKKIIYVGIAVYKNTLNK